MMISIVIPLLNEEKVVPELYQRLRDTAEKLDMPVEFLFIDDGSVDQTVPLLLRLREGDPRVKVVCMSRNFGHQAAITCGIEHARGDAAVLMDGDLQDPPELILELVKKWREGFDVVYAVRRVRRGESALRLGLMKGFYRLIRSLSDIDIPYNAGHFRLLSRPVVEQVCAMPERNRFIAGMTIWVGFKQGSVEYDRDPRFAGATKMSVWRLTRFAIDGITSFSDVPLRFATYLGLLVSSVSALYLLRALYQKFFTTIPPLGYTSLFVAVMFLGGIQMMILGVIGEYLARVYQETKQRPIYIAARKFGFERELALYREFPNSASDSLDNNQHAANEATAVH
jgi:glycosyltransferase involved in cell wall biosynthesis